MRRSVVRESHDRAVVSLEYVLGKSATDVAGDDCVRLKGVSSGLQKPCPVRGEKSGTGETEPATRQYPGLARPKIERRYLAGIIKIIGVDGPSQNITSAGKILTNLTL